MAALVLDGIQVKRPRCQEAAQQGYANATELIPAGEHAVPEWAHHIVGEAGWKPIRQGQTAGRTAAQWLQNSVR